jgi:DsbC/DsbD-like thiol-disulfide interchange protein
VPRSCVHPRAAIAALVLLASGLAPNRALAQRKPIPPASELVKLALVADTTHVRAGKQLTVAARFDIAPGWHIYWENPGEAGLATEAQFSAPTGYEVGPPRYPGPVRFQTPGENAASYGYSGQAMLSSTVAPPKRVADQPARFSVQASWLACREVCIRGQARATLEVPAAARGQAARAANKELFERHRAELPRPAAELRATSRWQRDDKGARLLLGIRGADRVEYFPPTGEDLHLVSQQASPGKGATELRLTYKPGFKPARARGVVAVTAGKERRYYALNLEESP